MPPIMAWRMLSPGGVGRCTAGEEIRTPDVQLGKHRYGQSNALVAQRLRVSFPLGDQLGAHIHDAALIILQLLHLAPPGHTIGGPPKVQLLTLAPIVRAGRVIDFPVERLPVIVLSAV